MSGIENCRLCRSEDIIILTQGSRGEGELHSPSTDEGEII